MDKRKLLFELDQLSKTRESREEFDRKLDEYIHLLEEEYDRGKGIPVGRKPSGNQTRLSGKKEIQTRSSMDASGGDTKTFVSI